MSQGQSSAAVIALQSLMWYLEVRCKRCIPAAGSLNTRILRAFVMVLNKKIHGSSWNPVVCFRNVLWKPPSSQPGESCDMCLCILELHLPTALQTFPQELCFHHCAPGGRLGWGNYSAQSESRVLSDLVGKKFVQFHAQLWSNCIFRLFKPSFRCCSIAV